MYYPYLRGRQNELICLRELLNNGRLSYKIIPVIEPVRLNSTFLNTLSKFNELNRRIILIQNPKVGELQNNYHDIIQKLQNDEQKMERFKENISLYESLLDSENIIKAFICDDEILTRCIRGELEPKNFVLINQGSDNFDYYEENGSALEAYLTFIPNDIDFKDEVIGETILLEDCFNKEKRNIDYINNPDEPFSRNHLRYKKRGYVGFSDYSIVGETYDESGFAPLAVAIHILYLGGKKELRVHHFVSESNENISDPARKFAEAIEKLLKWELFDDIHKTYGLKMLINYYKEGRFPGLGVIKKCSIMHHMELIGSVIEDE